MKQIISTVDDGWNIELAKSNLEMRLGTLIANDFRIVWITKVSAGFLIIAEK